MQSIQREANHDRQPSSVAFLAAIIDRRARDHGLLTLTPGPIANGMPRRDANVLVWVEDEPDVTHEPAGERHRGMIVVAHGSDRDDTNGSFIISYPIDTGDHLQHVPAVSGELETMGWSLLASRRGSTPGAHVNTAMLVNTTRNGGPQRLWLAEPADATPHFSEPASVTGFGPLAGVAAGDDRARELGDAAS